MKKVQPSLFIDPNNAYDQASASQGINVYSPTFQHSPKTSLDQSSNEFKSKEKLQKKYPSSSTKDKQNYDTPRKDGSMIKTTEESQKTKTKRFLRNSKILKEKQKIKIFCFEFERREGRIDDIDNFSQTLSKKIQSALRARLNWIKFRDLYKKNKYKIYSQAIFKQVAESQDVQIFQKELKNWIIMPNHHLKVVWDALVTLAYFVSFFFIPFVIAFDINPLTGLRWAEFTIDFILLADFILTFFTAQIFDTMVEKNYLRIALTYLKFYFVFDILGTLPGLCISENIDVNHENNRKWTYYLKIFRFLHYGRMNESISSVLAHSKKYWISNRLYIENFFKLFKYVTSIYYILTNATTIGYGDNYGQTSREKTFLIFLQFSAICIFSLLSGHITSLRSYETILQLIKRKESEINQYLYNIDSSIPRIKMDNKLYDNALDYIKVSSLYGIVKSIKQSQFYRLLTPQLKDKLVGELLFRYYEQFYFFFNDFFPPPYQEIIQSGSKVNYLCFIYKGEVKVMNKNKEYIIVELNQGSFFGDYQILFSIPSNYNFISDQNSETWIMNVPAHKFLKICEDYPKFNAFLCQRALIRRNHFRRIELKIKQKFMKTRKTSNLLLSSKKASLNYSLVHKQKIQELMSKYGGGSFVDGLLKLQSSEKDTHSSAFDQINTQIQFHLPMIRMHIQAIQRLSFQLKKSFEDTFRGLREFNPKVGALKNLDDVLALQLEFDTFRENKTRIRGGDKIIVQGNVKQVLTQEGVPLLTSFVNDEGEHQIMITDQNRNVGDQGNQDVQPSVIQMQEYDSDQDEGSGLNLLKANSNRYVTFEKQKKSNQEYFSSLKEYTSILPDIMEGSRHKIKIKEEVLQDDDEDTQLQQKHQQL